MGRWLHRNRASEHKLARAAAESAYHPGWPCAICGHPIEAGERWELDHADDGTYRGLAHSSPCRVCGRRCNQSEGGRKGAIRQGKRLADRLCCVCGKPYVASEPDQATCGSRPCVAELRRRRRAGEPDGEPPAQRSRSW